MKSWDQYASVWDEARAYIPVENGAIAPKQRPAYLQFLGDEWGDKASVAEVVSDFILPYINRDSVVLDLGCGGGRIATKVRGHCGHLACADPAPAMINLAKKALLASDNVSFWQIDGVHLKPPFETGQFDFVYCFDVMVHLHIRTIARYLQEVKTVLRPQGTFLVHLATIESEAGWNHFWRGVQGGLQPLQLGTFEYAPRPLLNRLYRSFGFEVIKSQEEKPHNFYYRRDLLQVLRLTEK